MNVTISGKIWELREEAEDLILDSKDEMRVIHNGAGENHEEAQEYLDELAYEHSCEGNKYTVTDSKVRQEAWDNLPEYAKRNFNKSVIVNP